MFTQQKLLVVSLLTITSAIICFYMNKNIPHNYMDEMFHLDQTIKFYESKYNYWNKQLTTFPGSFLLTSFFLKFVGLFTKKFSFITFSRIFTLIISNITILILGKFNDETNGKQKIYDYIFQLIITLIPINFFYNFIFYTDAFSTLGLVTYFYFGLKKEKNFFISLITSSFAVLMRQNNIIWINLLPLADGLSILGLFLQNKNFSTFIGNIINIIKSYFSIIILDLLFVGFLYWNDFSVVLGDKGHHEMCLHLAQINHFLIFGLVLFPFINTHNFVVFDKKFYSKENIFKFIPLFIIMIVCVFTFSKYSYMHEFLLSDNRHYSFYYFRKIYNVSYLRKIILIYVSFTYSMIITCNFQMLNDSKLWAFLVCLFMCLVPVNLMEFRYFFPCFGIFLILLEKNKMNAQSLYSTIFNKFQIIVFIVQNLILLFVFIALPFKNPFFNNVESRFIF